ncbi:MAG TPA: hypothetical protein K8V88_04885 [Companilactobacillus farciminis]|uniref:Uncharacterized protein n=1 Tax=Companilactobacillus farciminis TaxID=1612 RepID=A0A921L9T7_9LACO|nr:hypothetical protein [Companilactobacillus farciminis]
MNLSKQLNTLIDLAMKYRSRQLIFRFISTEHNRHKYISAALDMEKQKKFILTAMGMNH